MNIVIVLSTSPLRQARPSTVAKWDDEAPELRYSHKRWAQSAKFSLFYPTLS